MTSLLLGGLLAAPGTTPAAAAAGTPPLPPPTVTQDALPTVQVNGTVWDQVVVGTTVYAVGNFTSARPAGKPHGTGETPRTDILAYDITTGALITSFHHVLDGPVKTVVASPNGSRIYIGGQFLHVDGQQRNRIAAFSTATGALVKGFAPAPNAGVSAIAATNSTVYFGGNFGIVDGNNRDRLAAVTSAGALTAWTPAANSSPNALLVSPNGTKVIIAGTFSALNTTPAHGIGALSPTTGATLGWAMSTVTQDGTEGSGFLTLSTDGRLVYTGGFAYGTGDFEGTAAMNPVTGQPAWINDCWGDVTSLYPHTGVLYVASHEHDCSGARFFTESNPIDYHFGLAYSTTVSSNRNVKDARGWDYSAYHTSSILQWNPFFTPPPVSKTNNGQATFSVTGTGNYVVFAGAFRAVNGTPQQGLVRFTTHAAAPNAFGPAALGTVRAAATGDTVRVTTSTRAYDPDDGYLTYQLIRNDDTANPVDTETVLTPHFWQPKPALTLTDTSAVPGATYTYRMRVIDPGGSSTGTNSVTVRVPAQANLALHRPAYQSSTYASTPPATAGRAVDGHTNGVLADHSVASTNADPFSWWRVDLQSAQQIGGIAVWNRTDCCGSRLADYWVFASTRPFNTRLTPTQQAAQPGVWSSHQTTAPAPSSWIPLATPTSARYVMIQENTPNTFLSLAEVGVYAPGG